MDEIDEILQQHGLTLQVETGDGNCLFSALSRFLNKNGYSNVTHEQLRREACDYILKNRGHFEYYFVDEEETFDAYVTRMRMNFQYGDHFVLVAIMALYRIRVTIYSVTNDTIRWDEVDNEQLKCLANYNDLPMAKVYHKNKDNPGLCHYDSIVPLELDQQTASISNPLRRVTFSPDHTTSNDTITTNTTEDVVMPDAMKSDDTDTFPANSLSKPTPNIKFEDPLPSNWTNSDIADEVDLLKANEVHPEVIRAHEALLEYANTHTTADDLPTVQPIGVAFAENYKQGINGTIASVRETIRSGGTEGPCETSTVNYRNEFGRLVESANYRDKSGMVVDSTKWVANVGDLATNDSVALGNLHYATSDESTFEHPTQPFNRMVRDSPCPSFVVNAVPRMTKYHSGGGYDEQPRANEDVCIMDMIPLCLEKGDGDQSGITEQCEDFLRDIGLLHYFQYKGIAVVHVMAALVLPTRIYNTAKISINTNAPAHVIAFGDECTNHSFSDKCRANNGYIYGCGSAIHPDLAVTAWKLPTEQRTVDTDASLARWCQPILKDELAALDITPDEIVCYITFNINYGHMSEEDRQILRESLASYILAMVKQLVDEAALSYEPGTARSVIASGLDINCKWIAMYIKCCASGERMKRLALLVQDLQKILPQGCSKSEIVVYYFDEILCETDYSEAELVTYIKCCEYGERISRIALHVNELMKTSTAQGMSLAEFVEYPWKHRLY
jgi:hypothetical protein